VKTTVGLHPSRIVTLCVLLSWIGLLGLSKLLLDNEAVQWVLESIAVVGGGVILLMVRRSK
jgi:hypothetical protein